MNFLGDIALFCNVALVFLMLKLLGNGIKRLYLDRVNFFLLNITLFFFHPHNLVAVFSLLD